MLKELLLGFWLVLTVAALYMYYEFRKTIKLLKATMDAPATSIKSSTSYVDAIPAEPPQVLYWVTGPGGCSAVRNLQEVGEVITELRAGNETIEEQYAVFQLRTISVKENAGIQERAFNSLCESRLKNLNAEETAKNMLHAALHIEVTEKVSPALHAHLQIHELLNRIKNGMK